MQNKTIGILTSGGDAPGMNPAIRSVVRTATENNYKVIGIKEGYSGLLKRDFIELDNRSVGNIIQQGGTFLHTSRCPEFLNVDVQKKAADILKEAQIDVLIVLGGDGSFRGANELAKFGTKVIGIPCTIDNDIGSTDYTIGFDTAVNTAVEMVDRIRDTSRSHSRCCVVEVMGRNAGYIAVESAISCGATAVLVPEFPYDIDSVVNTILESEKKGKKSFIVIVAEGVGSASEIAKMLGDKTGITTNAVVLGYVQRGGTPSNMDRVIAAKMGYMAIELINKNIFNQVIVRQKGEILPVDIQTAVDTKKKLDSFSLDIANTISK